MNGVGGEAAVLELDNVALDLVMRVSMEGPTQPTQ